MSDRVLVSVSDGRITAIDADTGALPSSHRLPGLVIPGMGNAHSHAFHRALRSRTQRDRGSFWTWRDLMYQRGGPARSRTATGGSPAAVYAEMALAGITSVGEFHYLHHDVGGVPLRRPQRDGPRPVRGRRRCRCADDPAGHLLPQLRGRRDAAGGRAATAVR